MASLQDYYNTDFNYAARVQIRLKAPDGADIDAAILYDFAAHTAFLIMYVPGADRTRQFFLDLVTVIVPGGPIEFSGKVLLPSGRHFPGQLQIDNMQNQFVIKARFHGEPNWILSTEIKSSMRVFIYSETQLSDEDILKLQEFALNLPKPQRIQFRSLNHAALRLKFETPLAFICHDSRDKDDVARPVAMDLLKQMCPVWYDEYSLSVGDNLHDKIMDGLKKCKKCILVLSPKFFSNGGWTKREFESIFTREIMEEKRLVLPIWFGVSKADVYNYSPSLLNVVGLNWNELGREMVCHKLVAKILSEEPA